MMAFSWKCGGKATALGGRWNRDDTQRVMLATAFAIHRPPPSQSGGSIATALQSFAKYAASRYCVMRAGTRSVCIVETPAFPAAV